MEKIIYQFWTNDNHGLTPNRIKGIQSANNNFLECTVKLVDSKELEKYILPDHPLHEGYQYLSNIHKSDYLRSYFMNFYGGGYADIKIFSKDNNWSHCFDIINSNDNIQIIGEPEIIGGSPVTNFNNDKDIQKILCNCWFICKPNTEFTNRWYNQVQIIMDKHLEQLKNNTNIGDFTSFGEHGYPIRWAEIHGEVLHPLEYEFNTLKPYAISNMLKSGKINETYR